MGTKAKRVGGRSAAVFPGGSERRSPVSLPLIGAENGFSQNLAGILSVQSRHAITKDTTHTPAALLVGSRNEERTVLQQASPLHVLVYRILFYRMYGIIILTGNEKKKTIYQQTLKN